MNPFKILFSALITCLTLALLLLFCLPIFLSTEAGQKQFETTLSYLLHATVKVEKIELRWLSSQKIQTLSIASPDYHVLVNSIEASDSLFRFVLNGFCFSDVQIIAPAANITHIQKAGKKSSLSLFLAKHITLSSGSFTLQSKETLEFSDLFFRSKSAPRSPPCQVSSQWPCLFSRRKRQDRCPWRICLARAL